MLGTGEGQPPVMLSDSTIIAMAIEREVVLNTWMARRLERFQLRL
jgi:hypothetical protein